MQKFLFILAKMQFSLFNFSHTHTYQIIYSILYFIKISIFFILLIVVFFLIFLILHIVTIIHFIPLSSVYIKKEYKIRCKMSNVNVNLHSHCINFANFHIFNLINVNNFETYKYIKLSIFLKILY